MKNYVIVVTRDVFPTCTNPDASEHYKCYNVRAIVWKVIKFLVLNKYIVEK